MHLEGKVAVVSGAGRGIGRAIATALAAEGAAVVVNDLGCDIEGREGGSADPARDVVEEIRRAGGEAVANSESVDSFDAAGSIIHTALDAFGRLDILVNVAGNARQGSIFSLDPVDWREHLAVHLDGTFFMCRHAAPIMRSSGGGRIINMASDAFTGSWGASGYAAAKAGIYGLTMAIATEGASSGITANCLAPEALTRLQAYGREIYEARSGGTKSDWDWENVPGPEFVGPIAVYLSSDAGASISGCVLTVRGANVAVWSDPAESWWLPGHDERTHAWTFDELNGLLPGLVARKSEQSDTRETNQSGTAR